MYFKPYFGIACGLLSGVLVVYITSQSFEIVRPLREVLFLGEAGVPETVSGRKRNYSFVDFKGVPQDDPALIDYIRREVLHPPATGEYKLGYPRKHHFSQHGQSLWLDTQIIKGMRNGFFIEVGACDGETFSNSIYFERDLGWTGLLIEPNANMFNRILAKNRKAYSVNSALSLVASPTEINLIYGGFVGEGTRLSPDKNGTTIKAFPLYSLLLALNVTTIDYFSLDIEGQELKVLKTLPWDKLKFKILGVEKLLSEEGVDKLIQFVEDKGYVFIGNREFDAWFLAPELYVKLPNITM